MNGNKTKRFRNDKFVWTDPSRIREVISPMLTNPASSSSDRKFADVIEPSRNKTDKSSAKSRKST